MNRLSCAEALQRFFAYLDRALAGDALEDLEAHLEACLSCCDKLAFSKQLDEFVKRRVTESPMSEGLEARVRAALRQAGRGR